MKSQILDFTNLLVYVIIFAALSEFFFQCVVSIANADLRGFIDDMIAQKTNKLLLFLLLNKVVSFWKTKLAFRI